MHWIIFFVLGIVLFIYVLSIALSILPALGTGAAVSALAGPLLRSRAMARVENAAISQGIVQVGWNGGLVWSLDEKAAGQALGASEMRWAGTALGMAAASCVLLLMHRAGAFRQHTDWFFSPNQRFSDDFSQAALVAAFVITLIFVRAVNGRLISESGLMERARGRVAAWMGAVEDSLRPLDDLRTVQAGIGAACARLGIAERERHDARAEEEIRSRIGDILRGGIDAREMIEPRLGQARREAASLNGVLSTYESFLARVSAALAELAPLGSRSILDHLDLLRGYAETARAEHLPRGEWGEFEAKMAKIAEVLDGLRNFAREDRGEAVSEMDEACRVLGVAPGASKKEARKRWLALQKIYHPDRFVGQDEVRLEAEEMLKRVNWAYEVVSKSGGR